METNLNIHQQIDNRPMVNDPKVNNDNNRETSIAPISSKRIKLNGTPRTGVGQTPSPGTMHQWKLMKDKRV